MRAGSDYISVGVGAIIVNDQGEILLLRRGPAAKNERGCWTVPGGQVDYGETLEASVRREVLEEVGLNVVEASQLTTNDHIIPANNQHWVTTTFLVTVDDWTKARLFEPEKNDRVEWFALDSLPTPLTIAAERFMKIYRDSPLRGSR